VKGMRGLLWGGTEDRFLVTQSRGIPCESAHRNGGVRFLTCQAAIPLQIINRV